MIPSRSIKKGTQERETLTQADVDRLLRDVSPASRIDILRKVSGLYDPAELSEGERVLAEQIFRLLVRDSAVRIREALAENLKDNPYIPKDIILNLARDVETVAAPVLAMSEVLSDDDILNILRSSEDIWRYLAVGRRGFVSERLSTVLVATEHCGVICTLLENRGAVFSDASFDKVAELARHDRNMADKLAVRPSLPIAVVEKLMSAVSEAIALRLTETYGVDHRQMVSETQHALERNTLDLLALRNDREQTLRLVQQLYHNDRLTASLIINALCHGNLDFFEFSLAALAKISPENAHLLVTDPGNLGFQAIYNESGLPLTMLEAVRTLLTAVRRTIDDGVRPGGHGFSSQVIAHMVLLAEEHPVDNFSYMLALLRHREAKAA